MNDREIAERIATALGLFNDDDEVRFRIALRVKWFKEEDEYRNSAVWTRATFVARVVAGLREIKPALESKPAEERR